MKKKRNTLFYGQPILRGREQAYIEKILAKHKQERASEELKQKIYEELMEEKFHGRVTIPFKVLFRRGTEGKYPDQIEVILDTKV